MPVTSAAEAFLFNRINYERMENIPRRSLQLNRMRHLLELLGNPQSKFPIVHIAGTKGKGSTCSMVAAISQASGLRVGLYTSPHLDWVGERFQVQGVPATANELAELVEQIEPVINTLDAGPDLDFRGATFFEITTAMAFRHFSAHQVDLGVIEVGMGGRLDSTNVCTPAVTAITSISLDHTKQLGNSVELIAREKAGIIKPGVPMVSGVTAAGPAQAIEEIAGRSGSPLLRRGVDFAARPCETAGSSDFQHEQLPGCYFDYCSSGLQLKQLQLGLAGKHQVENGAVAIAIVEQLQQQGWKIEEAAIRQGLAQARCPIRMEILGRQPTIMVDAAHNEASAAALASAILETFPHSPRTLIFGSSLGKDIPAMLGSLLPCFERVILTRYLGNPRACDPDQLLPLAQRIADQSCIMPPEIIVAPTPAAAWERTGKGDANALIVATGSFYLAAEVRCLLKGSEVLSK